MNEKLNILNIESIRQLLNHSTAKLDQSTLAGLSVARKEALQQHEARSSVPAFAWAGLPNGFGNPGVAHPNRYYWAAIVLIAACLFSSAAYWQQSVQHDIDVDLAILTDDLPVDVYVD
ncbi:MAG: DUF3619 family protein [Nitrosomonadales bacterium]